MPHATAGLQNGGISQRVHMNNLESDSFIDYAKMKSTLDVVRSRLQRPLLFAEKVLFSHLDDPTQELERGTSYLRLRPDRVASHDATAQTVFLQLMSAGLTDTKTPMTVYSDHLITARVEGIEDLGTAWGENREVWNFLSSACAKFGVGLWKPGSGIFHQVLLENYAFPGGLTIGTDSHTPNAGGLAMCAIGVGGGDTVDVLAGLPWEVKQPKIFGVRLTGRLNGWATPKDIILKLAGLVTVKGGTGAIMEYFGPGVETLSCTGMATICNMGAEIGATTSMFPFTDSMYDYLVATKRSEIAEYARLYAGDLCADAGSEAYYDKIIDIDLSSLEPYINGPFTPDLATPISEFARTVRENGWPEKISVALIGSCTNASYEDMSRAASVAADALDHGMPKSACKLTVTPGSELIRGTIERDGQLSTLKKIGGIVLANACGPCIGNWDRFEMPDGQDNSILSSYNRNFAGRNDGNAATHAFVASPELVVAMSLAGTLLFNPLTDDLKVGNKTFRLKPPSGQSLPSNGYKATSDAYQEPPQDRAHLEVNIPTDSNRLQAIPPFPAWNGRDAVNMPILIKTKGKTTTDAISAAGPWLKYRGHLDNISNNLLIGATNAENDRKNKITNVLTGKTGAVPATAREYKAKNLPWVVIGDNNFGEGSSREHAALEIRHLGGFAVIARSFARIHETNLKKQGVLPLTFVDENDYDKIHADHRIDVLCKDIAVNVPLTLVVRPSAGEAFELQLHHSLNEAQIEWFKEGSALNAMAKGTATTASVEA
ncbi:hypothetical protein PRZ48_008592 [Zasmidium cellare]|uniref:Aconitate hydratase, mitochondrial n=1 Tax=Zasmidium cellare TaxID=395010 RepID=A0ABR0EGR8_ZASCE|nr:hypothetical protein PRZ48_008592 [Zasmidium cellare]